MFTRTKWNQLLEEYTLQLFPLKEPEEVIQSLHNMTLFAKHLVGYYEKQLKDKGVDEEFSKLAKTIEEPLLSAEPLLEPVEDLEYL